MGGHDRESEWQPRTPLNDLVHRRWLRGHSLGADTAGEQVTRLLERKQVKFKRPGTFASNKAREPVAARHEHMTAGRAGQQRPHLVGVARVVEQDEHPLAGEQAPVQARLRPQLGRDSSGRYFERTQESTDCLGRAHRGSAGPEPTKIHVELTIREVVRHPMCPVDGECRLTDPRRPGDR